MPKSPGVPGTSPTGRHCPLCQPHPEGGFGRTEEAPMLTASVTAGTSRGDGRLITNPSVMGGCHLMLRSPLGDTSYKGGGSVVKVIMLNSWSLSNPSVGPVPL